MSELRQKCPWDRKQTHESLKKYLIEETYEVIDAIDKKDWEGLKEELGDLLVLERSRNASSLPNLRRWQQSSGSHRLANQGASW
jgi:hypothetical protein